MTTLDDPAAALRGLASYLRTLNMDWAGAMQQLERSRRDAWDENSILQARLNRIQRALNDPAPEHRQ